MCDPLTLGTLAIGAAGTAANSIGQMKAAKKQEEAYNSWAQQQEKFRAAENLRQEDLRKTATAAQEKGVADISAEAQTKAQADEAARLAALYSGEGDVKDAGTASTPVAAADTALSGQQSGGEVFQADLARGLADAASSAKQRIAALGEVNAYGGSFGGLGTRNPIKQQEAGSAIDLPNEKRRGSMGVYSGAETAIDPMQIDYSNPIADVASQFLGVGANLAGTSLAGGGGSGLSKIFKVKPKVGPTLLPPTAPVPTFRPQF